MDHADLSGLPPLRGAVIEIMHRESVPVVTTEQVQHRAGVDHARALAYLSILVKQNVVRICGQGFARGPSFEKWATSACLSRPRHSGHAASDRMHAIFLRVAKNIRAKREERGWSIYELAQRSGVDDRAIGRLENMRRHNIPFPALMLLAQALDTTVELLAANC